MEFKHNPILLKECIDNLNIQKNGIYVDCTLGGGGHSSEILKLLTSGKLICIDKDEDAISHCKEKFKGNDKIIFVKDDFKNIDNILSQLKIDKIDGAIMDLGVSSYQLDNFERGFSYRSKDDRLDMRMDKIQSLDAYTVVNTYEEQKLIDILREFGEEKFAYNIVKNIIAQRSIKAIETTGELVAIIDRSIPLAVRRQSKGHSAKKTFQAIRIEVNGELSLLDKALIDLVNRLNSNGRIVVLTFHSLEDRIVKQTFKLLATDCICDKNLPCICNHHREINLVNNKPIVATESELETNSRAASAKLRIVEKVYN